MVLQKVSTHKGLSGLLDMAAAEPIEKHKTAACPEDYILAVFYEKRLNGKETARIKKHITKCACCRDSLKELKEISSLRIEKPSYSPDYQRFRKQYDLPADNTAVMEEYTKMLHMRKEPANELSGDYDKIIKVKTKKK